MVSFCYATDSCSEALSAAAPKSYNHAPSIKMSEMESYCPENLPLPANSTSTANASSPLCAATARPTTGGKTVPSWMLKMLEQSDDDDDDDDEIPGPEYNGHATKTITRSAILVSQEPDSDDTHLNSVSTVFAASCSPSDMPCLSSSAPSKARGWSTDEDRACILEMTEVCKDPAFQGKDKRWDEVSRRLATRHSIIRSGNAVKNQWNRRLRKETNGEIEDRSAKRSDRLVTSTLTTTSSSTSTTTPNSTLTSPDSITNTTPISNATSAAKSATNAAALITPCRKRARIECGNEEAMSMRHKARKMTTPVNPVSLFRLSASSQARPATPMIYKQMRMVSKEEAARHPSHNRVRSGHTASRVLEQPSKTMAEKCRAQNVEVDSEDEAIYTPSLKSKAALKVRMLLEDSEDDRTRIAKVSKGTS